jgi:hypothetical protein
VSADLETIYRRTLRWYPKKWRAANEDAVVGTLLDLADEESRSVPAKGELVNLRVQAISTRVAGLARPVPLAVRTRATVVAIGLGTAISGAGLLFSGLQYSVKGDGLVEYFSFTALMANLGGSLAIYTAWLVVFVASILGLRRISTGLLAATILISLVLPLGEYAHGLDYHPGALTLGFLDMLAVIALLGSPALPRRFRLAVVLSTLGAGLALAAAFEGTKFGYWGYGALGVDYFWAPFATWLIWLGIPLGIVAALVLWRVRRSPWASAIMLMVLPIVPLALMAFVVRNVLYTGLGDAATAAVFVASIFGILRLFGLRIKITRV